MRQLTLLCALSLAACGTSARDEIEAFNRHQAEANVLLAPELPRGWHYSVRADRIRNKTDRLIGIPNEDTNPSRDQKLLLMIQQDGDGTISIFFRGNDGNGLGCATVCGIEFRAGDRTGSWYAERDYTGEVINILDAKQIREALEVIRSSKTLIVEVDSDLGGQYEFKTSGLQWPPKG